MLADITRRLRLLILLGVTSLSLFAISFWLLYKAGCASDTKGGSYGDPLVALSLEGAALPLFVLAFLGAISFLASLTVSMRYRVAVIVAFVFVGTLALWLTGLRVESWGVRTCF
jgi:hypothetical protein